MVLTFSSGVLRRFVVLLGTSKFEGQANLESLGGFVVGHALVLYRGSRCGIARSHFRAQPFLRAAILRALKWALRPPMYL